MRGLMVLTGVVDEDYEGEIHVMVNVVKTGNAYLKKGNVLHNYYFCHMLNQ
jgi:dUTPase